MKYLCIALFFLDRKSTRLNSSHVRISYAVFCLKKKNYYLSAVLALLLAVQGASVGLTRRNELAALFFGGAEKSDDHRMSGVLLDTSVIIDGRILDIAKTGFLDFFFNTPASTEIYTLSLHDALPIFRLNGIKLQPFFKNIDVRRVFFRLFCFPIR